MTNISLVHPDNQAWLKRFRSSPHHAVIFELNHRDEYTDVLELIKQASDSKHAVEVNPNEALSIDHIRQLQKLAKLRKSNDEKQLLCIDMRLGGSVPAENSLLKTLEEPPLNTILVIAVLNYTDLLPTIRSRSRLLRILPLGDEVFEKRVLELDPTADKATIKAIAVASNKSFMLNSEHLTHKLQDAKDFLSSSMPVRISRIRSIKDRQIAGELVAGLLQLASFTQISLAQNDKKAPLGVWTDITKSAIQCDKALKMNGNVGLQMLKLSLSLPAVR